MNKYYELKSQESWLSYLITSKREELDNAVDEIIQQHKDIKVRISKMEANLIDSIDSLLRSKTLFLEDVGGLIVEWRKCIHP